MKIIFFEGGRVSLLFPFEEIVPPGGADGRAITQKLIEKYEFLRFPDLGKPREEFNKTGYVFGQGKFKFQGEAVSIGEFSIFSDGLVVNANTTERAEAFLDEVIQLLLSEFSFRDFTTKPRRLYVSQIVVEFEKPLAGLVELDKIAKCIAQNMSGAYKPVKTVELARIDFEIDSAGVNHPIVMPRFIIERRAGAPFEQERFFSGAPTTTKSHVKTLEEIEKLLG